MNDFRIGKELNDEVKSSAQEIVATKFNFEAMAAVLGFEVLDLFNSKKGKLTIL